MIAMKKNIIILCLILFGGFYSNAQKVPYNVVFDITSADTVVQSDQT